jgi:GNAT superfamily N-acetyltransferase
MALPAAATPAPAPVHVRPAVGKDVPFVAWTWKTHYRNSSPWASRITSSVYYQKHDRVVARLMARSSALVASIEDELAGYIVFEARAVHFIYVKPPFRRAGIARALFVASGLPPDLAGVAITHPTWTWFSSHRGGSGLEEKFPLAEHDPYIAFEERP